MPKFIDTSGIYMPIDDTAGLTALNPASVGLPSGDTVAAVEARLVSDTLVFLTSEIQLVPSSGVIIVASGSEQWASMSGPLFNSPASGISGIKFWGNETVSSLKVVTGSGLDGYIDRDGDPQNFSIEGSVFVSDRRFYGGNSGLYFSATPGLLTNTTEISNEFSGTDDPITVIAVIEPSITLSGSFATVFGIGQEGNDFQSQIYCGTHGGTNKWEFFRRDTTAATSITMLAGDVQFEQVQLVTWVDTGSQAQMFVNGVEITDGVSGTSIGSLASANRAFIGGRDIGTNDNFWQGAILEVAVYTSGLSDTDRALVENDMMMKWGIDNG